MKQNPADWRKYNTVMALQPELFKKQMQSLRFTHSSDTDLVFDLQGKIFHGQGANMQMRKLCVCRFFGFRALGPSFAFLRVHGVLQCDDERLVQLCKWMKDRLEGNASRPLTELVIQCPHKNAHLVIVKRVAGMLSVKRSLTRLHPTVKSFCPFPNKSIFEAFAATLEKNTTLYDVDFTTCRPQERQHGSLVEGGAWRQGES